MRSPRCELPVRVAGVIGATENLPSGSAVKPGDIVRAKSGVTIEVNNTDAEGRLVLADCLAHAIDLGAERLVDLATLTGAIVVALGRPYAGLFANDDPWAGEIARAGSRTGEEVWRMPLHPDYAKLIEGRYGDIVNSPSRPRRRGELGRRVPAPLRRRRAVGAPGHRRHGLRQRQALHVQGRRGLGRAAPGRAGAGGTGRARPALSASGQKRKVPTRPSRRWAVAASSWAEAAICWAEAEVSSVVAVTSSAEAEDCSATAATSPTSVWMRPVPAEMRSTASAMSSTRVVTSTTAASMFANASRASATVRAPASVREALLSTTSTTRAVSCWIWAISSAIEPAADWEPSASWRTSSATTANPRPCSPARAASMAAFNASRLVWAASAEIVSTIDSISLERTARSRDRGGGLVRGALDAGHGLEGLLGGDGAGAGDAAGGVGGASGLAGADDALAGDVGGLQRDVLDGFDAAGLALGAGRDLADGVGDLTHGGAGLLRRRGHLARRRGDGGGRARDLADQPGEAVAHAVVGVDGRVQAGADAVGGAGDVADLVGAGGLDRRACRR